MAEPRLEICDYCETPTWCEVRQNGKPQCRACKVERFFEQVLFRPLNFRLLGWQRKILREIYGTVDIDSGERRYRRAYISVAKKNGKSFLIGGLPIYHMLMEDETRPHAYGAASAKDQAGIVYQAAAELVKRNPVLGAKLKVLDSTKRIIRRDGAGFYAVLSADGDLQDGIEPSLAIVDELHRWKTKKAETLYDVLTKGTMSRKEPLIVQITTAGEINDSQLCWREHEFASRILRGSLKSDRFYPAIWSANEEKLREDSEYWKSKEARIEANPSHEDLGGFLKDSAIVEELDKAITVPAEQHKYLRYNLNVWVTSETRYISATDWDKCKADLRPLIDRACWIGLDLSSTTDLTAMVCVFPDLDGTYDVLPFFWMAAERISERERRDRVTYATWEKQGHLLTTPGWSVDRRAVKDKIIWASQMFRVQSVCYDPWGTNELVGDLQDAGVLCAKIPQGYAHLSEPTKKLSELAGDGRLRHADHPILRWNADCATVKADDRDNVMLTKPDRMTGSKRIDGMSALVNAMQQILVNTSSVYERRGILSL